MNQHTNTPDAGPLLKSHGLQALGPIVWFIPPDVTMTELLGLSAQRRLCFRLVAALAPDTADTDVFDRSVTTIWGGQVRKTGMTPDQLRSGGARALVEPIFQSGSLIHPLVISIPSGAWNTYAWEQLEQGQAPIGVVNGRSLIGLIQDQIDLVLQGVDERPIDEWSTGTSMYLMHQAGNFWVLLSALVAQGVDPTGDEARWIVAYNQNERPPSQTGYAEMGLRDFLGRPGKILMAAAERVLLAQSIDPQSASVPSSDHNDIQSVRDKPGPERGGRPARII